MSCKRIIGAVFCHFLLHVSIEGQQNAFDIRLRQYSGPVGSPDWVSFKCEFRLHDSDMHSVIWYTEEEGREIDGQTKSASEAGIEYQHMVDRDESMLILYREGSDEWSSSTLKLHVTYCEAGNYTCLVTDMMTRQATATHRLEFKDPILEISATANMTTLTGMLGHNISVGEVITLSGRYEAVAHAVEDHFVVEPTGGSVLDGGNSTAIPADENCMYAGLRSGDTLTFTLPGNYNIKYIANINGEEYEKSFSLTVLDDEEEQRNDAVEDDEEEQRNDAVEDNEEEQRNDAVEGAVELKNWCYDRCVSEWGHWSRCTVACGGGSQSRVRSRVSIQWCPQIDCPHALSEQRRCNEGCSNVGVASGSGYCDCPPTHQGDCCDRERTCDYPGSLLNGAVEGRWPSTVGQVAFFSCCDGYHLVGADFARCTSNGWSHAIPSCEACPLNTYKASKITCELCPRNSHTDAPAQIRCVCDAGYTTGCSGECVDVDECAANGGLGPCEDTCQNTPGSYRCSCTIPGYVVDLSDPHACQMEQSCRALTAADAPIDGALICMYLSQANLRYCAVRANSGYEHPNDVKDYETCGGHTNFTWSHHLNDSDAVFPPRISEIFDEFRWYDEIFYLPTRCTQLTSSQQRAAKSALVQQFNDDSVCQNEIGRPCSNSDLTILCGPTTD